MRRGVLAAVALLPMLLVPPQSPTQEPQRPGGPDPEATLQEFIEEEQRAVIQGPELPEGSTLQTLAALDSTTARLFLDALRELYRYQLNGFQHRARVFRWQFYSSIVIFVIVHLLVLAGLYFSWMQFRKGWEGMESQVEISHMGIKVQSSVLGVIILVVSLGFFYLYLVYVYPISEIV